MLLILNRTIIIVKIWLEFPIFELEIKQYNQESYNRAFTASSAPHHTLNQYTTQSFTTIIIVVKVATPL